MIFNLFEFCIMKHIYYTYRIIFVTMLTLFFADAAFAQSEYQPYSYQFYQKLNEDLYSTKTREHTSLKPFLVDDSLLKFHYDSLMNYGSDGKQRSLLYRKLFNEYLI